MTQAPGSPADIARLRLRHQRLVGPPQAAAADVVARLGAVQAQDHPGALWGLAQRLDGATEAGLAAAFDAGAWVRTHVLRPTWHFVAPGDLRWLLMLTGPRVHRANGTMYRKLELDEATLRAGAATIEAALAGGKALTRAELGERLGETSGMRLTYLVMYAELEALVCSGPVRGKQHTYMRVEDRVPPAAAISRDEALATLAARYFASHGPATDRDFAWWSGLTLADARRGMDAAKVRVTDGWGLLEAGPLPPFGPADGPVVHLLPNYDEHTIAYADYGATVDPAIRATFTADDPATGKHHVVRDGLVVGGWRRGLAGKRVEVEPMLRTPVDADALAGAIARYAAYLGRPVAVI